MLVIGSGIAGLIAAARAAPDHDVTLITKADLGHSNTRFAQGGIAAVVDSPGSTDSVEAHVADTLAAGAGLADAEAVRVLCGEGPARLADMMADGVAFDRTGGQLARGLEAAHSQPRVLHAGGDATGAGICAALIAHLRSLPVEILEHTRVTEVCTEVGRAAGVRVLAAGSRARTQQTWRRTRVIEADHVILATGGAGQLYAHTTNPLIATGDGLACAARAGAALADLEFYQFHPTTLARPGNFLLTEAIRGEGALLTDAEGRRFMAQVPGAELAARDVVARAVTQTMAAQGGAPVLLDATGLGAARLARRFPGIDTALRRYGIDWSRQPVPVTPAAHYWMGGVATDLDGRTSVPGLWAVGEVARTGAHGANRLASNSLLEGAVFAHRAVRAITSGTGAWSGPATKSAPGARRAAFAAAPAAAPGSFSRAALQHLMWDAVGLVRSEDGLAGSAATLATWASERSEPATATDYEDDNLLLLAAATVAAARARTDSVGAHMRSDSPATVLEAV